MATRFPGLHAARAASGLLGLAAAAQLSAQAPLPMLDRTEYGRERLVQLGLPSGPHEFETGPHPGKALAMDGNTLVVGAEYYDTILTPVPQGAVVFEKRNGEWEPVAKLLPDEPVADGSQFYGQSVALEDDLVVVSFGEDGTIGQRSVYIYVRPPGGWPGVDVAVPRTWRLSLPLALGGGASVAMEDGVIVTGAPLASLVGPGEFDTPRHGVVVIHEPPLGGWQTPPSNPVAPRPPDHLLALATALFGEEQVGRLVAKAGGTIVASGRQYWGTLDRSGLTWNFVEPQISGLQAGSGLAESPSGGSDFSGGAQSLAFDGETLLIGYTASAVPGSSEVVGGFIRDPGSPPGWQAFQLGRAACLSLCDAEPAQRDFGQSVLLTPRGAIVGSPNDLPAPPGVSPFGALYFFDKPATGWETEILPYGQHYSAVNLPPIVLVPRYGHALAGSGGELVVSYPYPVNNPDFQLGGLYIYSPQEIFADGFEAPPLEPASLDGVAGTGDTHETVIENGKRLYLDKEAFCVDTAATHATHTDVGPAPVCSTADDTLPQRGNVGTSEDVGTLRFTSLNSTNLFLGGPSGEEWTGLIPGPDLAISGAEELEIRTLPLGTEVHAFGFVLTEPFEINPRPGESAAGIADDSIFTVTLLHDTEVVHAFDFNVPDLQKRFIGVWSDVPFDRVLLEERLGYFGNADNLGANEYFGPFYTGTAVPPPVPAINP
jgi:hypothetical protein